MKIIGRDKNKQQLDDDVRELIEQMTNGSVEKGISLFSDELAKNENDLGTVGQVAFLNFVIEKGNAQQVKETAGYIETYRILSMDELRENTDIQRCLEERLKSDQVFRQELRELGLERPIVFLGEQTMNALQELMEQGGGVRNEYRLR